MGTLDSRTCEVCGSLDGKVYKLSYMKAGETVPPYHPSCRCTTVPYYDYDADEEEILTRIARDQDGNIYEVPADMTYKEWLKNDSRVFMKASKKNPDDIIAKVLSGKKSKFKEITDAIDFNDDSITRDFFFKWESDYIKLNSKVNLTEAEKKILEGYTEGDFLEINAFLRNDLKSLEKYKIKPDVDKVRRKAEMLSDILNRYELQDNIVTHRIERDVSWLTGSDNSVEALQKMIGSEYTAEGFTSSSFGVYRTRFGGGRDDAVHFEIITPKETRGAYLHTSKKMSLNICMIKTQSSISSTLANEQ